MAQKITKNQLKRLINEVLNENKTDLNKLAQEFVDNTVMDTLQISDRHPEDAINDVDELEKSLLYYLKIYKNELMIKLNKPEYWNKKFGK